MLNPAAGPLTPRAADPPDDAIAVVGLSCRLPDAPNPDAFWHQLRLGRDSVRDLPAARWAAAGATPPVGPGPGVQAESADADAYRGGFLDQVDTFDAGFFGISPNEAAATDPQQRLMLELAWEALESANVVPASVRGTATGVFVGAAWDDYASLVRRHPQPPSPRHLLTGLHRSLVANRVSYVLGLRGPSLVVDTGQSSSLVAVHLAVQSLRSGESELALVGGVNLILDPQTFWLANQFAGLSPTGRCATFDQQANGFVRGEGGVVVVLRRLADAVAGGDRIHAVIRGTAVNNDGPAQGLTLPSQAAQTEVLHRAYARAGITPDQVQYVELHGTGTKVGDPIEAAALGAVFSAGRTTDAPLVVGSAKPNIGHLEAAAGLVGLLKVMLCMTHRQLVPTLNFTRPNPAIPLAELRLRVQQSTSEWPRPAHQLIAGVSAFGMGGTNCHVVLCEPPRHQRPSPARPERMVPFLISARTAPALRAQAARLAEQLGTGPEQPEIDLARTLAFGRSAFGHRAVVLAQDRAALGNGLAALAEDSAAPGVITTARSPVALRPARPQTAASDSCSPDRAVSVPGWGANCTRRFPCSRRPSTRPARTSTPNSGGRCGRWSSQVNGPCWTRPVSRSRRCSPWRSPSTACWRAGSSFRTTSSATPSANWSPPMSRASCPFRTPAVSSPPAAS